MQPKNNLTPQSPKSHTNADVEALKRVQGYLRIGMTARAQGVIEKHLKTTQSQ